MGGISAYHCSIFRLPSRGETREESKGVIRGYTREINAIHSPTPSPPPPRATHYSTSPPFHTAFDVRSRTSRLPQLFLLNSLMRPFPKIQWKMVDLLTRLFSRMYLRLLYLINLVIN